MLCISRLAFSSCKRSSPLPRLKCSSPDSKSKKEKPVIDRTETGALFILYPLATKLLIISTYKQIEAYGMQFAFSDLGGRRSLLVGQSSVVTGTTIVTAVGV